MKFDDVFIEGIARVEAPQRITSAAIEDDLAEVYGRLGIPNRCIESLVGIVARRFWDEDVTIDAVATDAARAALTDAGVAPASIGALVSTSVSKEYLEPSVASMVHGGLGLDTACLNFDLANACLGFVSGMTMVGQLIESRQITHAVVVAGESSRRVVGATIDRLREPTSTMQDFKDYLPTLTLGSGSVAMVLCHRDHATKGHQLTGVVSRAATEHCRICLGTYDWMRTDAPKLLTEGVELAHRTLAAAEEEFGMRDEVLGQYICHQVGAAHLAALLKRLDLQREKAFLSYPEFGNMGSAALPFTLSLALDAGAVRPGMRVGLMGIGSGLNCSMAEVKW